MKYRLFSLSVLSILLGCAETKPTGGEHIKDGYQTPEAFFDGNKKSIEEDYFEFWGSAIEQIDTVNFKLLYSVTYEFEGEKIFSLRVAGQSTKSWSYAEKVVIGKSDGELIVDKEFIQIEPRLKIPECGVPNFSVDSLTTITIGKHELLAVASTAKFEPCCGQSEEQRTVLDIYTDSKKVESIELYYWNPYNGSCIEVKPEEMRKSTIRTSGNTLIVERTTEIKGKAPTSETLSYSYDGKVLQRSGRK